MIRLKMLVTLLVLPFFFLQAQDKIERVKEYYKEKKFEDAAKVLKEMLDEDENNPVANYYMAIYYLNHKRDPDEAEDYMETAIENDPRNAEYHFTMGNIYGAQAREASIFTQLFDAQNCKSSFEKAVECDPAYIRGRVALMYYHIQAPGIAGGDLDSAKVQAEALLKLDPCQGYLGYAEIHASQEEFSKAIEFFNRAIESDSSRQNAWNRAGYLALRMNKPDEAIKYFTGMTEVAPDNPNSWDSLGDGYKAAGNFEKALASYQKAVEINDTFWISLFNAGTMCEKLEKKERAKEYYKKYLQNVEEGSYADRARERLEEME